MIYKEGMMVDALATAVFVLGPEKGYSLCQRLEDVNCLIIDQAGKIILSPSLKDRISFSP
jgi:thiamine biosynthesis lipoprotein ApbE